MRVFSIVLSLTALFSAVSGCGIETAIEGDVEPSYETERAVFISKIEVSPSGSTVTCTLNTALISPDVTVPLFLEYRGSEVERTVLTNQSSYTFAEFNPPTDGNIVCVVEFADAEFESEADTIYRSP